MTRSCCLLSIATGSVGIEALPYSKVLPRDKRVRLRTRRCWRVIDTGSVTNVYTSANGFFLVTRNTRHLFWISFASIFIFLKKNPTGPLLTSPYTPAISPFFDISLSLSCIFTSSTLQDCIVCFFLLSPLRAASAYPIIAEFPLVN